ncbi:hypothetical protein KAR91_57330 [Candidatus Pacearchaeota archaeon]|nr:hypothetical protein [Candidatus Pacearchaeota archaeon]
MIKTISTGLQGVLTGEDAENAVAALNEQSDDLKATCRHLRGIELVEKGNGLSSYECPICGASEDEAIQ